MTSSQEPRPVQPRERRAHPRAACDWPITIQLQDGAHPGRLRDVSRAGISFFLDRRIPEMTILSVRIELPAARRSGQDWIDGRGVVVRCQPISRGVEHYEVAVFLDTLSEADRERLSSFVGAATA
jgi:hypothetical protein